MFCDSCQTTTRKKKKKNVKVKIKKKKLKDASVDQYTKYYEFE